MPNQRSHRSSAVPLAAALSLALAASQFSAMAQSSAPAPARDVNIPAQSAASRSNAPLRVARADRSFAQDAASAGRAEVMMGQLAKAQAANSEVKQYAERMVQDHSKANDELMTLAQAKGIQLQSQPTAAQKRMHDSMAKLNGAEFDRLYMAHMLSDHRKAVSLFEKQARSGQDAELRAFAAKTLPTLQDHLKMTTTLHDSLQQKPRS